MPTHKKRVDFVMTEEGAQTEEALRMIDSDNAFNTKASYNTNEALYPDNMMPFVDKHMKYISDHPNVNVKEYLSNLRLMTRIR